MLQEFISLFHSDIAITLWHSALESAPVWLTAVLVLGWFSIYMNFKQRSWIQNEGSLLLEIKVPREMSRSPAAMELFLHSLYQASVGTIVDVYTAGRVRPWFSLELVSMGGSVHFFIWMHKKWKVLVESQIYAQFPGVEVHEVSDYATKIHYGPDKINFGWFGQFALTKADVYPIRTYIDYGLDRDPKEEYKNDPLSSVLEYLGSLGEGEYAWIQILLQAHTKEGLKYGRVVTKPDWKKEAEKEIENLRKKAAPAAPDGSDFSKFTILTKGQQDVIAAIERNMEKFAFDSMIRATYFAENDNFDPNKIGGLTGSLRQFSSNVLNGFRPNFAAKYDYPWQDFRGQKRARNEKRLLEAYKRRSFFNPPFKNFHGKPFILSTEEVATLFHFPSQMVASTPTLTRLPSKKSEAPSNLPI